MKKIMCFLFVIFVIHTTINAQGLFDAIQKGNLTKVKELVEENGLLVNENMSNGIMPLFFAANTDKTEIVEYLLANGADVNFILLDDYYGITPLISAIINGNLEMVKMLQQYGANILYQTKLGENYLHFAAATKNIEVAKYLIDCGIDVNAVKSGNLTPLHITAIYGTVDMAKFLIENGANLEIKSTDGGAPLHFAIASRNDEMADLLRASEAKDIPREFPEYEGKYLGKDTPGDEPELFAPEIFRDIYRSYSPPVFTPDGKEVFWYGYFLPRTHYSRIWWMREENGKWTAPELAPFSDYTSWSPSLSKDGNKVYFASRRPLEGKTKNDSDIWYSEKIDGKWSEAKYLGSPPNRDNLSEMLPILSNDGTIYFKAFGRGARGTQMYKSKFVDGKYLEPQSLDDMIDANEIDDCPDIDHVITYAYGGPRYAEISICFHKPDGRWTKPMYMGDIVHQGQGSSNGTLSPDGKYLFFVQNISPYWIDASFIEDLRKEALEK